MKKILATFLLPILFLSACKAEEVAPEAVVPDTVVKTMDLSQAPTYEVTEIGTLKAGQESDLIAQAGGNLSALNVKLGDAVLANQTLALIGADKPNSAARISVENAELQLKNAQQNLALNKANNQDGVIKAQLRVQSLNTTMNRLNGTLAELNAQNANTQTSLEIQRSTLVQNIQLSNITSSNLQSQLQQNSGGLVTSAKTTLDGVFVNLDSNLARVESILNPNNSSSVSTSDLNGGLGEQDYGQLLDAIDTYNNYRWNLNSAKSNYEGNLPLSEGTVEFTALEAKQRVDEVRLLLAETREMLNASVSNELLPAQALEGYKANIGGAEAVTLGDLMKLDALSQSISSFKIEENGKIAGSQTNQVLANNQLAEADNALQKFYLTRDAAVKDLQTKIQQTQLELQGAKADLASAGRTAGLLNSSKDLELSTLNNQVRLVQNGLEDGKIMAKMDGVISELTVENGDYVSPGTRIGKIAQLKQITVVFYLSEEKAKQVSLGQEFTFATSSNSGQEFKGMINKIAPSADPMNKKIQIEGLVENSATNLKPETFVNIYLDLSQQVFDSSKIYVPMKAIIFGQNEKYVYVIENEMAVKREIEIGEMFGEWVEVMTGLNKSDRLIVEGQRNLPPEGNVKVNDGQTPTPNDQAEELIENSQAPNDSASSADQSVNNSDLNQTVSPDELLEQTPNLGVNNSMTNTADQTSKELYPLPEENVKAGM